MNRVLNALMVAVCYILISGCSDNVEPPSSDSEIKQLVNEFVCSEYGISTLKAHSISEASFKIDDAKLEVIASKNIHILAIPFGDGSTNVGRLNIIRINTDNTFRAIVETWMPNQENRYSVEVATGLGKYLATVDVTTVGSKRVQVITDVADSAVIAPCASKPSTSLSKEESWWECTTRVYAAAKKACGDNPQCDFLCDLCNLSSGCTISMAVAAAYVCL